MVTGTIAKRINQNLEEKFLNWNNLTHMAILRAKLKTVGFRVHCNILQH